MVVILIVMVGMGLDTGQITYTRSQGQVAVDAAALAAVTALPTGDLNNVNARAAGLTSSTSNNYVSSSSNPIGANSSYVTLIKYHQATGNIAKAANIGEANGVRVALEKDNPYGGSPNKGIQTPAFLTPLMKLFGGNAPASNNVSVSAVAVLQALPGLPIAVMKSECPVDGGSKQAILLQSNANIDNSCWTGYLDGANNRSIEELFESARTCDGGDGAVTGLVDIGTDINLRNGKGSAYDEAKNLFDANPGKCWIVPVVPTLTKCNQGGPHNIVDWATICPTTVDKKDGIAVTLTCQQSLLRAKDNLCFSSRLVRDAASGM
jgi:hypothetical protein